jgi:hypothetical protein
VAFETGSLQSLKYLLSGPTQKEFADPLAFLMLECSDSKTNSFVGMGPFKGWLNEDIWLLEPFFWPASSSASAAVW